MVFRLFTKINVGKFFSAIYALVIGTSIGSYYFYRLGNQERRKGQDLYQVMRGLPKAP
jgi:hypothetical protein